MEESIGSVLSRGTRLGNTKLHLACLSGNENDIRTILNENITHFLYLKNHAGFSPIFCIADIQLRNTLLKQYSYVAEAFSNQTIEKLREVVHEITTQYCLKKEHSLFRYGFYRAIAFDEGLEIYMDPFDREKSINVLQEMVTSIIKHLERVEGYIGFKHTGNLHNHSQDFLLIKSFYGNPILNKIFNLGEIDFQSLHLAEYRISLREQLITSLKELDQVLWDLILPDIIDEFYLVCEN